MLNEGILISDTKSIVKSEMLRQLNRLGNADPFTWERAVFMAVTGCNPDDVDWEFEDNQAGYYTWVRAFDSLIEELIDDGYVVSRQIDDMEERQLVLVSRDSPIDYSQMVYGHA